jgi:vacuolar-type H+-ATPase subunit H
MRVLLEKLKENFILFSNDATVQAEKGVKAAGQRARRISLSIEKSLKEFRKKSLDISHSQGKDKKEEKK